MIALVAPWGHAAAALLFALLAGWAVRRPIGGAPPATLVIALATTAAWGLATALGGPNAVTAQFAESGRNLAWLGFMLALHGRARADERPTIVALHAALAVVLIAQAAVDLAPLGDGGSPRLQEAAFLAHLVLRLMLAIGALVLVHNLYTAAAPEARWGLRPPLVALAAMWAYDLNLYTIAYLSGEWPDGLFAMRGVAMALSAPLFAFASRRDRQWKMRLSRAAAFQSLSLLAIGFYLVMMVIVARGLELAGGDYAQLAQVTVVFAMSVAALMLFPSKRLRRWLRVKLLKHLFQHRYDYRLEWQRFTDTLGRPGEDAAPLDQRVVQAIADITESPGGLLLLPDEGGGLAAATRWRWDHMEPPLQAADDALARQLEQSGRIIELDAVRRGEDPAVIPGWIAGEPSAWALVPLVHFDRLVGVVLLARPAIDRTLDWEDFDLLRVAGRQVASYLAEARGQEALSDARRFDEFNRRFAFIMHDIKNLVSQLSLLARNAERHAGNPEFHADMVITLKASVGKLNDLLARLSQHNKARAEEPRPTALYGLVEAVVAPKRAGHPIRLDGRPELIALADPARLEQAIGHIIQNAIDASAPREPVSVTIERRGLEAAIVVLDRGHGMSADFIRARLFRPFASTKEGGFGIGAFEARSLIAGMGGRLAVESREGEGSRFTIVLPIAARPAPALERKSA